RGVPIPRNPRESKELRLPRSALDRPRSNDRQAAPRSPGPLAGTFLDEPRRGSVHSVIEFGEEVVSMLQPAQPALIDRIVSDFLVEPEKIRDMLLGALDGVLDHRAR